MTQPFVFGFPPVMSSSCGIEGNQLTGTTLSITTQPVTTNSATAMAGIVVKVLDQDGDVLTSDSTTQITAAIGTDPSGGATLGGTTTVTVSSGVATFSDLEIDKNGVGFTLAFSATGITGATSSAFNIRHVLAFTTQPTDGDVEDSAMTAFAVTVRDGDGSTVTSDTSNITLTLATNPGGSTIAGTNPQAAVAGVATFNDIVLDEPAAGYSFTAAGPDASYVSATSDTFEIVTAATLTEGTTGLIFRDQFTRANNAAVGNDWTEAGGFQEISSNAIVHLNNGTISSSRRTVVHDEISFVVQASTYKSAAGSGWLGLGFRIPAADAFAGNTWGATAYALWQTDNGTNIKFYDNADARITHGGYAKEQWNTIRAVCVIDGSNLDLELLTAQNIAAANIITTDLTSRGTYEDTTPITGSTNNVVAISSDEVGDTVDEYMVFKAEAITVTGVPTGYKIQIDSRTAVAEVGGTVTIPVSTWKTWAMPCTTIKLLDSGDAEVDSDTPAGGIWGGHTYTAS